MIDLVAIRIHLNQPGTTSNEIALTCVACPVAKFSLMIGSPVCQDCDISQREYTDGPGSTQCRICSEGKFSINVVCFSKIKNVKRCNR